jgi:hypothetical protein
MKAKNHVALELILIETVVYVNIKKTIFLTCTQKYSLIAPQASEMRRLPDRHC